LPYIPLLQEAKDKQRKVCLVNLRGEVCTTNNCGKHLKVCLVADRCKGKVPKTMCSLWHMRVPFTAKWQGNFTERRSSPKPPPALRETTATMSGRPSRRSTSSSSRQYRAEDLKARIRAQKMMLQGFPYSQVVEGPAVPPR
jgi:hypothetical protein